MRVKVAEQLKYTLSYTLRNLTWPSSLPQIEWSSDAGAFMTLNFHFLGLFVYDRMAEDPPAALDDGVRAFVDLSTAEQIETYRHLEACSGPDIWLQASACERLAAKTIRSVYQTMLR